MEKSIKEKIKSADCNICKYIFFDPNDKDELQKCRVAIFEIKPTIDMNLLKYIMQNPNKKLNFCEYFDKR